MFRHRLFRSIFHRLFSIEIRFPATFLVTSFVLQFFITAACSNTRNVALHKPAVQSNEYEVTTYPASLAVDGNLGTDTNSDGCTHTGVDTSQRWWMVDLQQFYVIHSVSITNRGDCCGSRLNNFDVEMFKENPINASASRTLCKYYPGTVPDGVTEDLTCTNPVTGRFVRIRQLSMSGVLTLCEVQVFASVSVLSRKFTRLSEQKVPGNSIRDITTSTLYTCLVSCSAESECSAINVASQTGSNLCQLTGYGGVGQPAATVSDPQWECYVMTDG